MHLDIVNPNALKISKNLLYKIYRDPEEGHWSIKENKELEKWLKTAPKNILTKKRIKRRLVWLATHSREGFVD